MLENDLAPTSSPKTVYLKDYAAPDFLVPRINIDAQLGKEESLITATLELVRNPKSQNQSAALELDGEKVELISLVLDGKPLAEEDYFVSDQGLKIKHVGDRFSLEIKTKLQPHLNTELSGLYQSSGNFCTCLLYTSPSPRDGLLSRMPSSA